MRILCVLSAVLLSACASMSSVNNSDFVWMEYSRAEPAGEAFNAVRQGFIACRMVGMDASFDEGQKAGEIKLFTMSIFGVRYPLQIGRILVIGQEGASVVKVGVIPTFNGAAELQRTWMKVSLGDRLVC
jgi:hypothetical protein